MSHQATRHIGEWLGGSSATDGSVAYYLALAGFPKYSGDTLPSAPTSYNEWEDDWVAYGSLPDADDLIASIETPCVAVSFRQLDFPTGPDAYEQATGMVQKGLITLGVMLAVRGETKSENQRSIGYLARATHGSLIALGQGTDTQRTLTDQGIQLGRVQSFRRSSAQMEKGDMTIVGGWDVTYAITETVPVSM